LLDASKAFDKLLFNSLFLKLTEGGVPLTVIHLSVALYMGFRSAIPGDRHSGGPLGLTVTLTLPKPYPTLTLIPGMADPRNGGPVPPCIWIAMHSYMKWCC